MTIPYPSIAAELTREIASRESAYPRQVAKGHMTQKDADRGLWLARAWAEDCARYQAVDEANAAAASTGAKPVSARDLAQDGRRFPAAALNAFPWLTRWRGVQEELDRRAQLYPGWIAKGQLDQAEATQRIERLTGMLHLYDDMVDWQPRNGVPPCSPHARHQTPEGLASFDEAAPHYCAIMLRRRWITPDKLRDLWPHHAPAEQKEMFA